MGVQLNSPKYVFCNKVNILKILFHIGSTEKIKNGSDLLCEWGNDYCCFSAYDRQNKTLQNLKYITFDRLTEGVNDSILEELKRETEFEKVIFCSCFSQAILIPSKLSQQNIPFVSWVYDEKNVITLRDDISEWQLINSYNFPTNLHKKILTAFPLACFTHVYTQSIKIYNGYIAESQIAVHFTRSDFRIIVKKKGQLQLVQMYRYHSPLDVVYYLLKVVQEIDLIIDDTYIILSGLIEEDSALYKDLRQYFLNVHFALPVNVSLLNNELPQHFFTSMYNLAACG